MKYQDLYRQADKQQLIADVLQNQALTPNMPQQTGAVTPTYGIGHGLTQLGAAMLAKRQGKKADEAFTGAEDARQKAMAEALGGLSGQRMSEDGMGPPQSLDPYSAAQGALEHGVHPAVVQQAMQDQRPEGPKLTDDQREYEAAVKQGYQGSLLDFINAQRAAGANNTTINNEGSIPPGYELKRDAQGNPLSMVPIAGSPAAMQMQAAQEQAENRKASSDKKGDILLQEIDRSFNTLDSKSLPETGIIGQVLQSIPGTDAHSLQQNLMTIKANIGFDRLQEMRENSPTGGALGNVTVQEIARLESVLGSLAQSQNESDLRYNLARLNNLYLDAIHGPGNGEGRKELPELNKPESNGPAVGHVQDGYEFMGGDPSDQSNWRKR